ncbi:MAG: hypothetical protein ABSD52_02420 [Candidatus Cybelea sp.]
MLRSLILASAIGLALLPAVTLGAPAAVVRGGPVVQPPPPRSAQARSAGQDSFKLPFHADLRPRPAEPDMQAFLPYRWHALQYSPQYLWNQPAWNQSGCFANNLFGAPSPLPGDGSLPGSITIGSLVDGRSKNLLSSTPSYDANLPPGGEGVVTLQATSCGSARSINF